jgi:hypothetical protein
MVAVFGGGVGVAMVMKRMIQARWKDLVASRYGERTSTRSVQFDVFSRENFADKNGMNSLLYKSLLKWPVAGSAPVLPHVTVFSS